ncbi:MAG: endonuclease V [Pirellulales bacterium]|nr:endonuclease V [Pirellulales bacterium]
MKAQQFRNLPDLEQDLMELVRQVPAGRVSTYGSLAEALGNPVAARWVGHFLLHHQHRPDCPCHRLVRADGSLGQYAAGGLPEKAQRLAAEGVEVQDGVVDLLRFGFDRFQSGRPLARLTRIQEEIAAEVSLRGRRASPRLVAGVDVSYTSSAEGVAAYVLVESRTGRRLWTKTIRRPVRFPYITSYLSFREIPLLLDLIDEVLAAGQMAELLLVDGSGILHPRGAGIASHIGVAASVPTIGVTKKLLCGRVDLDDMDALESRPVLYNGKEIGAAIRPTAGSRRPIFVSPGNRVSLATAESIVRRLLLGRRLPEPLYWADRLSRSDARAGL